MMWSGIINKNKNTFTWMRGQDEGSSLLLTHIHNEQKSFNLTGEEKLLRTRKTRKIRATDSPR